MKFVTIEGGNNPACIVSSDGKSVISISDVLNRPVFSLDEFISDHRPADIKALEEASKGSGTPLSEVRLLAPIPSARHDILCVGVNYVAHLQETRTHFFAGKFEATESTIYFGKRARVITGPDAPIPGHFELDPWLDYEVELAVVIGSRIDSSVGYEELPAKVFGYSVFNDISARRLQSTRSQWYLGKSLDGYSVMGPWIVTPDEVDLQGGLEIESRINGEVRQHSNTRLMRMNVWDLLYEISRGIVLEPGDIIATGTPAGVGGGFTPPKYLAPGDVCEMEIQGIGVLRNTII